MFRLSASPVVSPSSTAPAEWRADVVRRATPSLRVLDDMVVRFIAEAPGCQRMEIIDALGLTETYVRRALPRLRQRGRIVGSGVRAAMRYSVAT